MCSQLFTVPAHRRQGLVVGPHQPRPSARTAWAAASFNGQQAAPRGIGSAVIARASAGSPRIGRRNFRSFADIDAAQRPPPARRPDLALTHGAPTLARHFFDVLK
ncbi:hypothetical protein GCM10023176_40200 [Micromonospora coerulea]|uniref:Uncharacterized protein n=1 Tax=Micromonospora coerulea TaxID=47856 RepID=A0ABP8SSH5_9ACTN